MGDQETTIAVRASPSGSKDEVVGLRNGALHLRVTAPAHEGKANAALMELLARALRVPKGSLRIVRGHSSRQKVVAVRNLSHDEIAQRPGLDRFPPP